MVGYGQMTEVLLWVQTTKPAVVQYQYWDAKETTIKKKSVAQKTSEENAFSTKTLITGLLPGKKYEYELLIDGKIVKRNYALRFQTQPLWQWRTDPPDFSVAFGSCAYINETPWDRPNNTYGGDYGIFSIIAQQNPDLMLWIGDNTYLREIDWDTKAGILHRYAHTRQTPEMQPILGAAHNYATWDDHDYGPNNADRSYRLRNEALETFKLFWGNQTYGTDETKGVFSRFTWGDVEFFLLDDRYHRAPNDAPDDEQKTMFGKEQMQWLKDALSNSIAPFKIVVNGNQILNPNGEWYEALPQYSSDYKNLLSYIKTNKISGIILLSGDRHHTELILHNDTTFYPLYDFTSSPLTSGLNTMKTREGNPTKEFSNPLRVAGTLVNDKRNFGMLRFSGKHPERKVVLETYDITGARRWSKEIQTNDLRVK
ncbi:MAG: alkaline phosphatase family protein [Ignavibacteriales bacterium]|nr:alkaline phosphatase family protein [Ignavibacteriales bacterium]